MRISANGIGTNYALEGPGDAPVVVLSHSLAANMSSGRPRCRPSRRLSRPPFRHAGHGGTDVPDGPYSLSFLPRTVIPPHPLLKIRRSPLSAFAIGGMIGRLWLFLSRTMRSLVLCERRAGPVPELKLVWDKRIEYGPDHRHRPRSVEPTDRALVQGAFRRNEAGPCRSGARHDPGGPDPARLIGFVHAISPRPDRSPRRHPGPYPGHRREETPPPRCRLPGGSGTDRRSGARHSEGGRPPSERGARPKPLIEP